MAKDKPTTIRGICPHGKVRFMAMNEPEIIDAKVRRTIGKMVAAGFTIDRVSTEEARRSDMKCDACDKARKAGHGKGVTPTPEPFSSERKVLTDEIQKATGVSPQVFGKQASPTPDKECPRCGSNSRQVYFGGCCGFCPDPWHSSTPKGTK